MFFYLKVSCKDEQILKKFTNFFVKIKSLSIYVKPFPKNKKRKFITILKSPHVNKTAQEQFEYRFFSRHFLVFSFKSSTFFLLLKRLKDLSFLGLKLEVKGVFSQNNVSKHTLKCINPDNIKLQNTDLNDSCLRTSKELKKGALKSNLHDYKLVKKYIQSFDSYGEIYLKNSSYTI